MTLLRSPRRTRPAVIAAATLALVAAACGSGDADDSFGNADDSFGVAQPTASAATTTPDAPTETDVPPTTTEPAASIPTAAVEETLTQPTVTVTDVGVFDRPVHVAHRRERGEIYVVEQPGRVVAVTDQSSQEVLDLTDLTNASGEQGLLGLAFHPTVDLAYVFHTDLSGDTVVAELAVDPASSAFDRDSYREVLTVAQPFSNHNGGQLAFGPDELLYIGLGDGGSGGDPERFALDPSSRLGKILRIDPVAAGDQPFTIPADNPFVGDAGTDPAIWSLGLRNPWRFSFDHDTGDLWIADVGQVDFEEINRSMAVDGRDAAKGANFGWSAFEGFEPFNTDQSAPGAVVPLFVYDHADGRCSVSGGTLARGDAVTDLRGWYVFGDYCTGQIWALDPTAPPSDPRVFEIAQLDQVVAIAAGPSGNLYAVSNSGTVARLDPG